MITRHGRNFSEHPNKLFCRAVDCKKFSSVEGYLEIMS